MYTITIIECKPHNPSSYSYAVVQLSEDLQHSMPCNNTTRPYPRSIVCKDHKVRRTTDKTFAFMMDDIGDNTCAIVLEEISYLTGISMMRINLQIDRCGEPAVAVLKLAQAIRATQTRLGKRPHPAHHEPSIAVRNTHVTS